MCLNLYFERIILVVLVRNRLKENKIRGRNISKDLIIRK